jgi:hypothetical protein
MEAPRTTVSAIVLDSADPRRLAAFYERLLGWVMLKPPGGGTGLSFQYEAGDPFCVFHKPA